jgi:hypothetical protein
MFIIRKDDKYVSQHDTETQALTELHTIQPYSWDYATQYGGYTIKEEKVVSIDPITHKIRAAK